MKQFSRLGRSNIGRLALTAVTASVLTTASHAVLIDHPDVNGWRTFQDTNTNRVWLDLDNFWNTSGVSRYDFAPALAAAAAAGFTVAMRTDVVTLLNSSNTPASWSTQDYVDVMASTHGLPNLGNDLTGYWDDTNLGVGFAILSGQSSPTWLLNPTSGSVNWPVAGTNFSVAGIFAYQEGVAQVPEPTSFALMGLGVLGVALARRSAARRGQL